MEAIVVVAVIGILAAVSVGYFRGTHDGAKQTKLESDVATVNQAIKMYLVNGGSLDAFANSAISTEADAEAISESETPVAALMMSMSTEEAILSTSPAAAGQAILDKLKTRRSSNDAAAFAGLTGAMLDKRLAARTQSTSDAASNQPRAIWNPTTLQFEIATSGGVGIEEFYLDAALAAVDYGEESREDGAIDLNTGDGWIWNYTDSTSAAPPSPTLIPVSSPPAPGTPNGVADGLTVAEDNVASTSGGTAPNVLANDSDPNGAGLFVTSYTQPSNGSVTISPDGSINSYLGDPNYFGADSFTYTVSNGAHSATVTVSVTVTPENDLPNLTDSTASGSELANSVAPSFIAGNLNSSVTDPDTGDTHTFTSAAAGSYGVFTLASNGSYSYSIDNSLAIVDELGPGDSLVEVFSVSVDDGNGGTDTANLTITINGVNDNPDLDSVAQNVTERSDDIAPSSISGFLSGSDAESTPLLYATTATPAYGSFNVNPDGGFTYALDNSLASVDGLRLSSTLTEVLPVQVTDSQGATTNANLVITILGANDSPLFQAFPSASALADGTASTGSIAGNFTDPDIGDSHTFSAAAGIYGAFALDSATGAWTYQANTANPTVAAMVVGDTLLDTVSLTVTDLNGASDTKSMAIVISGTASPPPTPLDPPVIATSDPEFVPTTTEDITVTITDPNPSGGTDSNVEYRVDAGPWTVYSGPFVLSLTSYPAGATVEAKAVALTPAYSDSSVVSKDVPLGTAPVIALDPPVISPNAVEFETAAVETVVVTITNPNDSAVSDLEYRVNGGAWTPYSGVFGLEITDYFLNGATVEARAVSTDAGYTDSTIASESIGGPSLEFTTYNLDINVGDEVTILDYLIHGSLVLGTHFEFFYEDAETWHLTDFNANQTITATIPDLSGGNKGPGEYRISVRFIGNTEKEDRMTIRIENGPCPPPQLVRLSFDDPGQDFSFPQSQTFTNIDGTDAELTLSVTDMTTLFDAYEDSGVSGNGDTASFRITSGLGTGSTTFVMDISANPSATFQFMVYHINVSGGGDKVTLTAVTDAGTVLDSPILTLPASDPDFTVTDNVADAIEFDTYDEANLGVFFAAPPGEVIVRAEMKWEESSYSVGGIHGIGLGEFEFTYTDPCNGPPPPGPSTSPLAPPTITPDAPEFAAGTLETINVSLADPNPTDSALQYRLDGGAWTPYGGPFPVQLASFPSGVLIEAQATATSAAFTDSSIASNSIGVNSPPTTPLIAPEISTEHPNFVAGTIESSLLTLTDHNPNPGVDSSIVYRLNGGAWSAYVVPFPLTFAEFPDGVYIEAKAIPLTPAFTESPISTGTVGPADGQLLAPIISPDAARFVVETIETVTVTITDPNPTDSQVRYRVEGGPWINYSGPFTLSMLDHYLSDADIQAEAIATSASFSDSPRSYGEVDEAQLEFTQDLDLEVGDSFQILDYLPHGSFVLGTHFEFFYEDAETWHLADFNANNLVTMTTNDLIGGNYAPGEYRVRVRYIGDSSEQDKFNVKIGDVPDPFVTVVAIDDDGLSAADPNVQAMAALHGETAGWLINDDALTTTENPCLRWNGFYPGDIVELPIANGGAFFALPEGTPWRLQDFIDGVLPQASLIGVADMQPLDVAAFQALIGATITGISHSGDITYDSGSGSADLDGPRRGTFMFTVLGVDAGNQKVQVRVESCPPQQLLPIDIAFSAPKFDASTTSIDVTLTDPNLAGTSQIRYHVQQPDGVTPDMADWPICPGGPFTVDVADYPDGFTVRAYAESIHPEWFDSPATDEATYAEFFGVPTNGDVLIVIDASSSMNSFYLNLYHSRYDEAIDEAIDLINALPSDKTFNVVMFDGGVHWTDGTGAMHLATAANKQSMIDQILAVQNDSGTNFQAGLNLPLTFSTQPSQVIFLSDGSPDEETPYQAEVDALAAAGIKVDTIGIEVDDGSSEAAVLQAIADETGGALTLVNE